MADDASFIGTAAIWKVRESTPRRSDHSTPLRDRTPGVKRITLVGTDTTIPSVSPARAVDTVVEALPARRPTPVRYEPTAVVYEWANAAEELPSLRGHSFLTSEYRQREPRADR